MSSRFSQSCALFLLILSISLAGAQNQPNSSAPQQPSDSASDADEIMHHLRRSTVSLGLHVNEGGKPRFVTVGSAVAVTIDGRKACLLTAKHVFSQPEKGYVPTMLYVRLPQNGQRSEDDLGFPIPLVVNGSAVWRGSEDADLAVVAAPNLSMSSDAHAILLSDFGDEDDVYQGAAVVVMGYPELLGPDFQTTPIARGGIVAWTNPNGALEHTFLVDANVFSGNSGGPVFHMPTGVMKSGGFRMGGSPKLIGIISKDAFEEARVHAGGQPVNSIDQSNGRVPPLTAQVLNIGGIGIVEPASKAKKLVGDFLDPFYRTRNAKPQDLH